MGRRLAFDVGRGRLWVVCPDCERWNLVPVIERWEPLEALEKLYRETPTRFSTSEIGVARCRSGFEVIRIGSPTPGEFAAWRYADQFERPTKIRWGLAALSLGAVGAMPVSWIAGTIGLAVAPWALLAAARQSWPAGDALPEFVTLTRLRSAGLTPAEGHPGFSLHVNLYKTVLVTSGPYENRIGKWEWTDFTGVDAWRLARRALPQLNRRGSRRGVISDAVDEIAHAGGPTEFVEHVAAEKPRWVPFRQYPKSSLLALEMALFEQDEAAAMTGDLERLAQAWREAEELAAISDDLLDPPGWDKFRERYRPGG